jgi:two-component system, NarL family, sensor histidine kinase ComP
MRIGRNKGGVFMIDNDLIEKALNHLSDILMICDRNRHIVYITPNAFEMSGYSPEEYYNRDTFFMVHPEDREYLMKRHENLLTSQKGNSSEYRVVRKNGEVRYCECKTTPLPNTENYLQVVSTRDITDRKLMELELERHKNRHEVLQISLKNYSQDLSAVMKWHDLEKQLIMELKRILPGSEPTILTRDPIHHYLHEIPVGKIVTVADKVFLKIGERHEKPYFLSINASAIYEKMESIWLETLAYYTVMVFENLNMIEGLVNQLDTALQNVGTPQWVLRMMFNLQEQQRLTLSSDLHDTVLQDQINLYRKMQTILHRNEIKCEVKAKLIDIEQGLLDIIHDIRMTCNDLRPPLLRELGLERSLENLFEHIQVTSTYQIIFTSKGIDSHEISEERTIAIYRLVQELLHYAETHSASQVRFNLFCEADLLRLVYSHDGVNLEEQEKHHFVNIIQRVESLGGRARFLSENDREFVAALEISIKEKGV